MEDSNRPEQTKETAIVDQRCPILQQRALHMKDWEWSRVFRLMGVGRAEVIRPGPPHLYQG